MFNPLLSKLLLSIHPTACLLQLYNSYCILPLFSLLTPSLVNSSFIPQHYCFIYTVPVVYIHCPLLCSRHHFSPFIPHIHASSSSPSLRAVTTRTRQTHASLTFFNPEEEKGEGERSRGAQGRHPHGSN